MYIRHILNSVGSYLKDHYVNGFSMFWALSLIFPHSLSLSENFARNEISWREARSHSQLGGSQSDNWDRQTRGLRPASCCEVETSLLAPLPVPCSFLLSGSALYCSYRSVFAVWSIRMFAADVVWISNNCDIDPFQGAGDIISCHHPLPPLGYARNLYLITCAANYLCHVKQQQ